MQVAGLKKATSLKMRGRKAMEPSKNGLPGCQSLLHELEISSIYPTGSLVAAFLFFKLIGEVNIAQIMWQNSLDAYSNYSYFRADLNLIRRPGRS